MLLGLVTSRPSCPRVLAEWNNGYSLAVPWPGGFTDQETPYNTTHLGLNLQRCVNKQLNTQRRAWLAACRSPLGALALWPWGKCSALRSAPGGVGFGKHHRVGRACAALPPAFAGAPCGWCSALPVLLQCNPSTIQRTRRPSSCPDVPPNARRRRTESVLPRGPPGPPWALPPSSCWVLHVRGL